MLLANCTAHMLRALSRLVGAAPALTDMTLRFGTIVLQDTQLWGLADALSAYRGSLTVTVNRCTAAGLSLFIAGLRGLKALHFTTICTAWRRRAGAVGTAALRRPSTPAQRCSVAGATGPDLALESVPSGQTMHIVRCCPDAISMSVPDRVELCLYRTEVAGTEGQPLKYWMHPRCHWCVLF